jgi:hypothetical protein
MDDRRNASGLNRREVAPGARLVLPATENTSTVYNLGLLARLNFRFSMPKVTFMSTSQEQGSLPGW